MAVFYAIFNRREQTGKQVPPELVTGAVTSKQVASSTAPLASGSIEDACVVRVEGPTTVAQVQQFVQRAYPTLVNGTTVVVTEAAFKES